MQAAAVEAKAGGYGVAMLVHLRPPGAFPESSMRRCAATDTMLPTARETKVERAASAPHADSCRLFPGRTILAEV
eukprot:3064594-Pyramimonas_sp.AAC.1